MADFETSSGCVDLVLTAASQMDIRTSSGKTSLRLPEGGAEIAYTAMTFERKGDLHGFGNGESKITVDSSSGNL